MDDDGSGGAAAEDEPAGDVRRRSRVDGGRLLVGVLVVAVVVALVAVLRLSTGDAGAPAAATPAPATTPLAPPPTAAPTPTVVPAPPPAPTATPTVSADPADLAELAAVAADLPELSLTSPTAWDQWLPEGKPYPGASTEDDIATCPRLADQLSAGLGTEMSYWIGTLPGPGGCTWAPVPLSYDGPYGYDHVLDVDFQGGTTVEAQRTGWYQQGGALCPAADAPAGAVVLRCEQPTSLEYLAVVPDVRGAGVWVLSATTELGAAHSPADALTTLLSAVRGAYG